MDADSVSFTEGPRRKYSFINFWMLENIRRTHPSSPPKDTVTIANIRDLRRPKLSETLGKKILSVLKPSYRPSKEVRAEEHAEHVESAVDRALPLASAHKGEFRNNNITYINIKIKINININININTWCRRR